MIFHEKYYNFPLICHLNQIEKVDTDKIFHITDES